MSNEWTGDDPDKVEQRPRHANLPPPKPTESLWPCGLTLLALAAVPTGAAWAVAEALT